MGQDNRVLWIFPNYRTVDEANSMPRIRNRDKWLIATKDSFDPYAFPVAGMFAAISQWEDQYPSWGRGWNGYKKRFAGAFADQTISNFMAEGLFPSMLHQDPRYFRLGHGSVWYRLKYAVTRIFVTRGDDGQAEFNYSEFAGNAVMAGASSLYYPAQDRSFGNTMGKWGFQIGFDMAGNIGKEFWPDIRKKLTGH